MSKKSREAFEPDAAAGSTLEPELNRIRLRTMGWRDYRKSVATTQERSFDPGNPVKF